VLLLDLFLLRRERNVSIFLVMPWIRRGDRTRICWRCS